MNEAAFAAELDRVLADLRGVLLAAYRGGEAEFRFEKYGAQQGKSTT